MQGLKYSEEEEENQMKKLTIAEKRLKWIRYPHISPSFLKRSTSLSPLEGPTLFKFMKT
jgi:hypothetical protein